jgi:hypothetical protein
MDRQGDPALPVRSSGFSPFQGISRFPSDALGGIVATSDNAEVSRTEPILTAEQLRNITDFDSAVSLLQSEMGVEILDASTEIGDGFRLLDNKDRLVDTPFVAVAWTFPEGDYTDADGEKQRFCVMRCVTDRGEKYILVDGSPHGICGQMRDFSERTRRTSGLLVKGGLRRSEYETIVDGKPTPGITHYLNV